MKQKYTISEMAELLGVTTHMLRHYEKMGIIRPEVNPENGYRFYSVIDTRRFNLSREFLACGLSLEQCAQLMGEMDDQGTEALLKDAIAQQQRQIEKSRIAIRFMGNVLREYPRLEELVGRVWVENLPVMWRLNVSEKEKAVLTPEALAQREQWLSCLPAVYWTSRIRKDTLRCFGSGPIDYEYGLMCYENDAIALRLKLTRDVERIPGGDYLVTIHEKSDRGAFTWENLSALTDYIQREHISVHGDAFPHILASRRAGDTMRNYHRVFMKIFS